MAALRDKAKRHTKWVKFKSPLYKEIRYCLVHKNGGIGFIAYENNSENQIKIKMCISGNQIQPCKKRGLRLQN